MESPEPPILLDGARVVRFALLDTGGGARRLSAVVADGVPVDSGTVTRIAMAEDLVDGSIIVMYCNEEWGTVAAERHPDLDTAQRSADAAYAGMALGWIEREPHGDEEREVRTTRDFLREIARDFGDG
jgi:hypothetical protein